VDVLLGSAKNGTLPALRTCAIRRLKIEILRKAA